METEYRDRSPVQSVDECLDGWLVDMSNIRGGLAWLIAQNHTVRVDQPERVDDNLALDGLNRVNDDRHRPLVQLFERLDGMSAGPQQPYSHHITC